MNLARRNLSIGEILPPMRNLMEGGFLVEPFELAAGRIASALSAIIAPTTGKL
jgi:hypothetical protein